MRIDPTKTPKEPTYQVVLDSLALSPLYPAFLITVEVPEIYMHQFWHTITKIKNSSSYKFKLDKKKCTIDVEVFCDILQICPRLPNQEFDAPPSYEEIVTFIKELGHKGDIKSITEVVVDQMHQLWRTFATIINKCLFGKTSDFMFQIDNRDAKKQEKIYYPRFTKAIIHHSISKDKSISMRNRIFMHTVRDDNILGSLRFVSKFDEYQVYGALLPEGMTNQQIQDSPAYKTYIAFATGAATPKKARKFKKPASPLKKKALVVVEEPAEKPIKKPAARRYKEIELLSESASLKEAQLKKSIKRSKQETNIYQVGSLSEGADLESEVLDELKGKSIGTSEGTGLKPGVPDVSKADSSESKYESLGDTVDLNKTDDEKEDEFVHTPEDYVPTDDETDDVDDEEYNRINKEMYDDVNVELKYAEPANEEKGDEEMSHAKRVDAKHEEVSQAVAGDQVKDDAQATVTAALATQKTKVPLQSSSISSDYATKFLNFNNIPSGETEIISMMDIKVQQEDLTIQTTPLLTVLVTVIHETSITLATTIPPLIPPFIHLQQQSTPIPTLTTTEATTSTTYVPDSEILFAIHLRVSDLEKEVKELKNVDHSSTLLAIIKSEVTTAIKEYLGTSLDDALYKHKALYHALIESILEDEDAMDKGVADKSNKRNPDDVDRDEGLPAEPN
ncbi:hypothetical protein Tco_1209465 [Tanacetum coccineum]